MLRSPTRLRTGPFAWLLVCALLLRALIPAGWMPAANGSFGLELCAGMGEDGAGARFRQEAQRVLDQALAGSAQHRNGDRSDDSQKHQPCAFSGLAMAFAPPETAALTMPPAVGASLRPASFTAAPGRGLAAPPPPATGPPAFA